MIEKRLPDLDIEKIASSGQCFRLSKISESTYRIIAWNKMLTIKTEENQIVKFDCSEDEFESLWKDYFDLEQDYNEFISSVDKSDTFLCNSAQYGKGIRILNQDPWEMLITFIISQRKNINSIKKAVEILSTKYGEVIDEKNHIYAFPTAQRLATASIEELNGCSLGYRSRYVYSAAEMVSSGVMDLELLKQLSDDEMRNKLKTIHGVGDKVADCIMLFGFHRFDAFPKDVWINRIIDYEYNGVFPFEQYKGFSGVIQQYIFDYVRNSPEYDKKKSLNNREIRD